MAYKGNKVRINLDRPLCTDEANPNIHDFNDKATNHQTNTGLVRRGGIAPLSVTADTLGAFANNTWFVADNESLINSSISGNNNTISLSGSQIGTVSAFGVTHSNAFANTNDAILTNTNTILTATLIGSTVTISEYTLSQQFLHSRPITFTILSTLPQPFTSLNFIRTNSPAYSNLQEFILRAGTNAFILRENNAGYATLRFSNLTNYQIVQSTLYKSTADSYMVFGTIDGKILSVDRFGNYAYPDGSGLGLGPRNNGTVVGNRNIRAMTTFNKTLVIVGDTGRIGSFDGNTFKNFDGSGFGTGIYDNCTVLGQNANGNRYVNAAAVYGDSGSVIVFSGDSGATGCYMANIPGVANGDGWHPSSSAGLGPWLGDNSQFKKIAVTRGIVVGNFPANINVRTVTYYKTLAGHRYLMFGADSGICFSFSDTWIGHPVWVGTKAINHGTTSPSFDAVDAVLPRTTRSATTWQNYYVNGGDSGYISSFGGDSGGWKKAGGTGSGTGPYSTQTAIGNYNVTYLNVSQASGFPSYLIAEGAGRMGTYLGPSGQAWSGYNGSYAEGLFNSGDANHQLLGSQTIVASCFYAFAGPTSGDSFYVVAGSGGGIACFDIGTQWWKRSNGSSNGPVSSFAPYNSGSAINNQSVVALLVLGSGTTAKLVVISANALANWNGLAWTNFDGTGAGVKPYDNNTILGGNACQSACNFGTSIALAAMSNTNGGQYNIGSYPFWAFTITHYISSIDSSGNIKKYDGTGSGTGPYNTKIYSPISYGTGLTYVNLISLVQYSSSLYCFMMWSSGSGAQVDVLFSFDGSNWKNYDGSGTGTSQYAGAVISYPNSPSSNETKYGAWTSGNLIPVSESPYTPQRLVSYNGYLVIISTSYAGDFYISSFDGSNWKYIDGTGSGTGLGVSLSYYSYFGGSITLPYSFIINAVDYNPSGTHYLVLSTTMSDGHSVISWDGSNWVNYKGVGGGTGPYNNGQVLNSTPSAALTTLSEGATKYLVVAGSYYVGNYNGTTWQNFNAVATGAAGYPHQYAFHSTFFGRATQVKIWNNKWIFSGNLNAVFCYDISTNSWEQVYDNKNVPATFFGDSVLPITVTQYKNLFIYCRGVSVNAFDGSQWYWGDSDATGLLGIPVSNTALGTLGANNNITTAISYNGWLVFGGQLGTVASFDGTHWKRSTGTGLGIGCYSNTPSTFINSKDIYCSEIYGNVLVFGASAGYMASFVGNVQTNYNATGTGASILAGNGTIPITSANIYSMTNYSYGGTNYLIIAGGTIGGTSGYLASWNGTSWLAYNGAGTGVSSLALNAFGTLPIRSITQHGNYLVAGDSHGNVFSFDPYPSTLAISNLSTWIGATGNPFNAGATSLAPYGDSVTLINKDATTQLISSGGTLYLLGNLGKLASWDGIGNGTVSAGIWNNYQGNSFMAGSTRLVSSLVAGTGIFNNGLIQTGAITTPLAGLFGMNPSFTVFNSNYLMIGPVAPFTLLNDQILFPHASSGQTIDLPQSRLAQVFAYRFENNNYLYGITNCNESIWYSLSVNNEIDVVNARFAVIQFNGTNSRALVSGLPYFSGNLNAFGYYGYNDFVNFTNYVVYPILTLPSPVIYQSTIALGAVDVTLSKGGDTNNFYNFYAPQFNSVQSTIVNLNQSNTNTLINAYGKLNNGYGLVPAYPFEFRNIITSGSQQALSVAQTGTSTDYMGVLITNYGEYDQNYIPHLYGDNTILYKYNGSFYIISITNTPPNLIQKIGENIYKINTISPSNILDVNNGNLNIGSSDFNGRALFTSTTTPSVTAQFFDALIQGPYSQSIDPGNKFIYISNLNSSNFQIIGYRIPTSLILPFEVDIYYNNLYLTSALNDGSKLQNADLFVTSGGITQGASYSTAVVVGSSGSNTPVVPPAQGYLYNDKTVTTSVETIFLLQNYNSGLINGLTLVYEGYGIGNQVPGVYQSFLIQGQTYLYDGEYIWFANFQNNVLTGKNKVAEAYDLKFISQSPMIAYFISTFDNSLFAYTQNYQLQPIVQLNELGQITSGVFGDGENTLLMLNSTNLVWMRSGIITENALLPQQQNLQLFNTTKGIQILGNDGNNWYLWQYYFYQPAGSTVVPLDWESGVFGQQGNRKSIVNSILINLHNPAKTQTTVSFTIRTINTGNSGNWNEYVQPAISFSINPSDWSLNGQRVIRIQPDENAQKSLGISLEIKCSTYVIIKAVEFEVSDDTIAIPEGKFTR